LELLEQLGLKAHRELPVELQVLLAPLEVQAPLVESAGLILEQMILIS
jgi:hypothetical protein